MAALTRLGFERILLVLSIAVLVLDLCLRHGFRSLDQSMLLRDGTRKDARR
jgi:hypothetical protein